jgi:hypothetical protein
LQEIFALKAPLGWNLATSFDRVGIEVENNFQKNENNY